MVEKVLVCLLAGLGAGLGTGFAGMSAAAVISPMLITFLGMEPYEAVGIALASDVLASAASAWTYGKNKNLDIRNGLLMMAAGLAFTVVGSYVASLVSSRTMGSFSVLMTMLLGIKFIIRPVMTTREAMQNVSKKKRMVQSIVCGAFIGMICGFVGAGGGSQYGTAYVGDAAHDFSDKTVYLTADLDMGGSSNWTPVGGLYPMDRDNTERVIVAYFNGTLDGQGHRITNLFCDRYAEKGYAYSQGIGLIGHMGDLYDGEAAPETAPAVRNLSVSGSIYGRRMVGGIVGRTGSIPTGIYLENCANHASVKNTDSKGVGGIVGAGWSEGAIVNCYNTGSVTTGYACPAGGICGSNGGLDIYNCYNAGVIDSSGSQRGRAIGGHNNGSYTVSDCYYLEGCDDDPASNGWYTGTALSCVVSVTAMPKADMRSQKLVDALNCNGAAYAAVQGSYPVLAWEAERSPAAHTVRITQPEGGTIAADAGETVAFGTVLHLSNTPDIGWAFRACASCWKLPPPTFWAGRTSAACSPA